MKKGGKTIRWSIKRYAFVLDLKSPYLVDKLETQKAKRVGRSHELFWFNEHLSIQKRTNDEK